MRSTFVVAVVCAAACSRAEDVASPVKDAGAEAASSWAFPDASTDAEIVPPPGSPLPCPCDAGGEVTIRFGDAGVIAATLTHPHAEPACITAGPSVSGNSCGSYVAACAGPDRAPPCLALRESFRGGSYVEADGGAWTLEHGVFDVLPDDDAGTATGTFSAHAIRNGCTGGACETDVRGTFHTCSDWHFVICD